MNKKLFWLITIAAVVIGSALLLQTKNLGTQTLWNISNEGQWILPMVLVAALIDSINPCAFSILLLTIALVVILELINTSLEAIVNLVEPDIKEQAKIAKDVSAAAVMTAAVVSIIVGLILFGPKIFALVF